MKILKLSQRLKLKLPASLWKGYTVKVANKNTPRASRGSAASYSRPQFLQMPVAKKLMQGGQTMFPLSFRKRWFVVFNSVAFLFTPQGFGSWCRSLNTQKQMIINNCCCLCVLILCRPYLENMSVSGKEHPEMECLGALLVPRRPRLNLMAEMQTSIMWTVLSCLG